MKLRGFSHTVNTLQRKWRLLIGNIYFLTGRLHGIEFTGKSKFIGKPKFKLYPTTKVMIDHGCEFLSGSTDNLIGINRPCILSTHNEGTTISIGAGSGFSGTVIGAFSGITIGANVKCGANTLITDSDWHPEDPRSTPPQPIIIEDNVWLGVNSTVLKGVTIGKNTIIGANSLVTKNIPANVIAAGNPCKVIKELSKEINLT